MGINTIAVLLIAAGVAADNILVASVNGNEVRIMKTVQVPAAVRVIQRGILMLILSFVIQYQVLLFGSWLAVATQNVVQSSTVWIAIGLLFTMGINMFLEIKWNQCFADECNTYNHILGFVFSTAVYVFLFGFAIQWLNINDRSVHIYLLLFIAFFLLAGWLFGRYHWIKSLNLFHVMSAVFVMAGAVLFFIEYINTRLIK